jgi:hypothetical protein
VLEHRAPRRARRPLICAVRGPALAYCTRQHVSTSLGNSATRRRMTRSTLPLLLSLAFSALGCGAEKSMAPTSSYKLNLRRLAKDGYAVEKAGKVRLRFVRDPDGTIQIRPNDSSPGLPVGRADF